MRSYDYYNYIQSTAWNAKKTALFKKYGYKCALCNQRRALDTHHITYENFGNEKLYDLTYLCRFHHKVVHSWVGYPLKLYLRGIRLIRMLYES